HSDKNDNNTDWRFVSTRNQRKQRKIIEGAGADNSDLKTVEKLQFIQAWSFRPETTAENISKHLNKIHTSNDYTVQKREIKTTRHAAFCGLLAFGSGNGFSCGPAHSGATPQLLKPVRANRGSQSTLTICHQNIASLDLKTQRLEVLLQSELECDIIAITEHWLREDNLKCVNIDGFSLVSSFCRTRISRGGSCLYVKNGIKAIDCIELKELAEERFCELSAIDLIDYNVIVMCLYRTNLIAHSVFLVYLERLLERASDSGRNVLLLGDFNIDWLIQSAERKQLSDLLSVNNFSNEVDFPTRVKGTSSTCLDHVYSNLGPGTVVATPVDTRISDHRGVRAVAAVTPRAAAPRTCLVRDYSEVSHINFCTAISSIDWCEVQTKYSDSLNGLATSVINTLTNKIQICFPLKRKNIRHNTWVNDEIKNLKSFLFEIFSMSEIFPDNSHLQDLINVISDKYDVMTNRYKSNHYTNIISKNPNTQKAMWRVVNSERGKSTVS
ncbi:putative tick transposon, partial [Operophtera brumata]